jgi:mono/diheme cytochrome c family protein
MTVLISIIVGVVSSFVLLNETQNPYINKEPNQDKLAASIAAGKEIYTDFCVQCHLPNGKGSEVIPPLDNSDWLTQKRKESIHAVKFGQSGAIVVNGKKYKNAMSAMGLTNEEIADVMNYIMNSWSNKQTKMVTVAEVESVKK